MRWLDPLKFTALLPALILTVAAPLMLTACSSGNSGMTCEGRVETLNGQVLGNTEGKIVDRFTSFHVTMDKLRLESGELYSSDPQQYIPSAVTKEGWLAQRLSDTRFSVINAPQDRMITFSCPARAI